MPRRALLSCLAALALGGCAGDGRGEALEVAERWLDAVHAKDADAACREMAPSAVAAIRLRYTSIGARAPCRLVVARYISDLPAGKLRAIRKSGLETEGRVENDEIGVFPVTEEFELDVILMGRDGQGTWKVKSTRIGPGGATQDPRRSPTPAPTPADDEA